VLALVVATSKKAAEAGVRAVTATYSQKGKDAPSGGGNPLENVVTIDDAIQAGSLYPTTDHHVTVNDAPGAIAAAASDPNVVTVTGELGVGGQEHFYLECMSTLCVPMEGGTLMDVFSSTQAPAKTQVRDPSWNSLFI